VKNLMKKRRHRVTVNLLLAAWTAGCLVFAGFFHPDAAKRNFEFLPNMLRSFAWAAQSESPFVDAAEWKAPAGSAARGFPPVPRLEALDADPALGEAWKNPFAPGDEAALKRGGAVFTNHCALCHGAGGAGDGVMSRRGVPPPPSLLAENARALNDARMFSLLAHGRGNMASYAGALSREDRWKAVLYVRSIQAKALEPPVAEPAQAAVSSVPQAAPPLSAAVSAPEAKQP
jgi:mono/diheme cytochrome c family protein